jgi:two-component system, NtrC family, response regulator GlrR
MGATALSGDGMKRSQTGPDGSWTSHDAHVQVAESQKIRSDLTLEICLSDLVGKSPRFVHVLEEIRVFAASDANVLISGETGTGKDMCARAIHYTGARAAKPFIPINCGSVPEDLWENQFFGHERGAYTDARERSTGLLKEADGGTLFLDDIEALTIKNQVKLLRFLQTGSYLPLCGVKEVRADVRVIAATNEDLVGRMREHTFRGDLYFRLAVLMLYLSPLRERIEDIPLLSLVFLKRYAAQYHKSVDQISESALASLCSYSWPGNVRELENTMHRAVLHAPGAVLSTIQLLPRAEERVPVQHPSSERGSLKQMKKELVANFEKEYVLDQLRNYGGNVSEAARRCGKNRRAFWELMRKYHITSNNGGGL